LRSTAVRGRRAGRWPVSLEPWELGFAWSRGLPVWVGGDGVRTDAWVEEGRSPEVGRKAGKVDVNNRQGRKPSRFRWRRPTGRRVAEISGLCLRIAM
jgi:hypothetical protein